MRRALAILIVILLVGCAPSMAGETRAGTTIYRDAYSRGIIRVYDPDFDVVCYMTNSGDGIFCLRVQ